MSGKLIRFNILSWKKFWGVFKDGISYPMICFSSIPQVPTLPLVFFVLGYLF